MISTVPEATARLSPVNHGHAVNTLQHTHTHTTRHLYKFNPCSRIVALVPLASSSRSLSGDGDRLGGLWLGRRNVLPTADQCRISPVSLSPLTLPYATVLPITQLVLFFSPSFSFFLLLSLSFFFLIHPPFIICILSLLLFICIFSIILF